MKKIKILSVGTKVKIIQPELLGVIIGISIRGENPLVKYEVVWWDGRSRNADWFANSEVKKADDRDKTEVGFNNS